MKIFGRSPARHPAPGSGRGGALIAHAVADFCRQRAATAILSVLVAGQADAQSVLVPCDLPITAMAPVHFALHPIRRHVAHRGGRKGVMRSLHSVANRTMCAVWEGLTDASLSDAYARVFGGDWPSDGGWGAGGDDFGGAGPFGDFGGGGFGGQGGTAPILVFFTPDVPATPVSPLTPLIPSTPDTPLGPSTPVPEPSTYLMMLVGFAGLGFFKWRRE